MPHIRPRGGSGGPGRVTLRDVAVRANVSIKTVSNVVHDYPFVSTALQRRVLEAINELGYQPNLAARSLRNGRSGVVALAVPFLDMPYFADLASLVIAAANRHDWTVLVDETNGNRSREELVAAGIRAQLIDGLIFSPLAVTAQDLRDRAATIPTVLLGERIHEIDIHIDIDHVAIDSRRTLRPVRGGAPSGSSTIVHVPRLGQAGREAPRVGHGRLAGQVGEAPG
jgi:DNA-binding LacI/PurR family transcriptional regulator